MRLHEKVIIVTGSTTGIGEATACRCAAEGARVVVHGRDRPRAEEVAKRINRATFHVDDLADPEAPMRLVQHAIATFGRIDGVVNNAAFVVRSSMSTTTSELFDRVMATNVRAPLLIVQAAYRYLKDTKGAVVNIGSVNAYCGESNLLAYSVSKGALMTLSKNLADALAPDGVRVTHINPGWVLTPNEYQYKIADGLPSDWPETVPREIAPSGRLLKPEEIAAGIIFWLSDESRPISGTVLDMEQYPFLGRNPTRD